MSMPPGEGGSDASSSTPRRQLSLSELRAARLASLGVSEAPSLSLPSPQSCSKADQKNDSGAARQPKSAEPREVSTTPRSAYSSTAFCRDFRVVMWNSTCSSQDIKRWYLQGIEAINPGGQGWKGWGLKQSFGGPCGVLGGVMSEFVRGLVFDMILGNEGKKFMVNTLQADSSEIMPIEVYERGVAHAIGVILSRAATYGRGRDGGGGGVVVRLVLKDRTKDEQRDYNDDATNHQEEDADKFVYEINDGSSGGDMHDRVAKFLLEEYESGSSSLFKKPLDQFKYPGGVVLLCQSLLATRTTQFIKEDMDYPPPDCTMTAQFGHCSQELINLLLTGACTSNVFDGVMDMGGGLLMKGIMERSCVGYLTQIEAMRYVQVGSYFKSPACPIWLVGSQSHFSILISLTMDPIRESESDLLLERCRRAFRKVDNEGAGFIQMTSLSEVLELLDLTQKVGEGLPSLAQDLEECDVGIILWEKFWKKISRLMTGASLSSVLDAAVVSVPPLDSATSLTPGASPNPPDGGNFEVEKFADTFTLYHYNGLRGGTVAEFRVTRLSPEDAVGASVALDAVDGHAGGGQHNSQRGLEEVARTRWPSAKFDWDGKPPPSID